MGGLRKSFLKVALVGGRKHMRITVLPMILCLSAPAAAQSGNSIDAGERRQPVPTSSESRQLSSTARQSRQSCSERSDQKADKVL